MARIEGANISQGILAVRFVECGAISLFTVQFHLNVSIDNSSIFYSMEIF